jgi:hypothetical protein
MSNTPENPNEALLLSAVEKLAPLLNRIAFVGGCATGLLVTDPAADPVRRTLDVDAIIAVAPYGALISLEESPRQCGFHESIEDGAPRCLWVNHDLILDLILRPRLQQSLVSCGPAKRAENPNRELRNSAHYCSVFSCHKTRGISRTRKKRSPNKP